MKPLLRCLVYIQYLHLSNLLHSQFRKYSTAGEYWKHHHKEWLLFPHNIASQISIFDIDLHQQHLYLSHGYTSAIHFALAAVESSMRAQLIDICINVPLTLLFSMMRLDVSELVIIFNRSATGRIKQVDVLSKVFTIYTSHKFDYWSVAFLMLIQLSFGEHLDMKMLGKYRNLLGLVHWDHR